MTSFLAELRRRNVLKVAAAYALVSWILIEAGSVLLPTFGAPEWFFRVYVLIVAAGFVIALIFAWVYELTPEGVKLERDVERTASIAEHTGRKLNYGIIGLLVVALAISITLNITGMRGEAPRADDAMRDPSIAVLPFTSRSTDPENALFADGIHDDLLTSLANVGALKVISRTSVLEYRETTKNLRDIAEELGVANVLEGAVQRAGNNVRINVQLIDARTDEHIWARIYDRELTAKNIFQIQSEISGEITAALKSQLTPEEQDRLVAIPTENLEAYRLYVSGRDNLYKRRLETLQLAREQFQQAIDLDPQYSQAYSGLADSVLLLLINHNAIPHHEAHAQARAALDRALALDENNVEAWASLGLLEMDRAQRSLEDTDFSSAEAAFQRALSLSPNHAEVYSWFAGLKGSQFKYDDALELYRKSLELDPLARIPRSNLAGIYAKLGRHDEALEQWLELARIHPEWPVAYENVAAHLAGLGRLDEAFAWSNTSRQLSTDPLAGQTRIGVLVQLGDFQRAAAMLENIPEQHPLHPVAVGFQAYFAGNYEEALQRWEAIANTGSSNMAPVLLDTISDVAALLGDYDKSLDYCMRFTPGMNRTAFKPDPVNAHNVLKYAYLLQREDPHSTRAAQLLSQLLEVFESRPRLGGDGHGIRDVQVLALQGKTDQALARLQLAYDEGFRNVRNYDNWTLAEDPYLDAIRDTPQFRQIAARMADDNAAMKMRLEQALANGDLEPLLSIARGSQM